MIQHFQSFKDGNFALHVDDNLSVFFFKDPNTGHVSVEVQTDAEPLGENGKPVRHHEDKSPDLSVVVQTFGPTGVIKHGMFSVTRPERG
jgi:hypothetical protein